MLRLRLVLVLRNYMCEVTFLRPITSAHPTAKLGQNRDWKARHKKICKQYNAFVVSTQYQALTAHDQVDALLLSHLVAEPAAWVHRQSRQNFDDPLSVFWDLLKVPRSDGFVPPLCLSKSAQTEATQKLAEELYARFGNNNFVLHSHLNSYGHGIFPLASRLFNHSCVPNGACKYIIRPTEPVTMEVIALYEIAEGEEVRPPVNSWRPLLGVLMILTSDYDPLPGSRPAIPNARGGAPRKLRIPVRLQAMCLPTQD